jgi:hypothetical protein
MPENIISSSPQLTQALARLRQHVPQSELARAGVEILVKHLAGNLVNLQNTTTMQSITLAKANLSATLHSRQTYDVNVIQRGHNTVLQFVAQNTALMSTPLSEKQLDALLTLPANKLLASPAPLISPPIVGRVSASNPTQLTLTIIASQPKQSLTIDIPGTQKFAIGSHLNVELKPVAKNWQINLTFPPFKQSAPLSAAGLISSEPSVRVNLTASQALPLIKTIFAQSQGANTVLLPLDNKAVQPLLQSDVGIRNKSTVPDVTKFTGSVALQIHSDGKGSLVALSAHPSSEITASKSNVTALSAVLQRLDIPLSKAVSRRLDALLTTLGEEPQNIAVTLGVPQAGHAGEVVNTTKMSDTVKNQALGVLHGLLRVVQARAELPSQSLMRIFGALADPQLANEPSIQQLSEQLGLQVKHALPQGKEQDASHIRQLLTQPTLSLNPLQILTPVPGQGLLGGLLALVQISLASRLAHSQPSHIQRLADALSPLAIGESSSTVKTPSPISPKGLSEFAQIEQKHQLLKELSRLFAGHQTSKLGNAEQLLQGQDTFYYTLPSAFGDNVRDIELWVRRERQSPEEQAQKGESKNRQWHLTMKLSVGEQGELLTKAKLKHDNLEINFYTSNESTRDQVLNFLPLLKKRLTALGIDLAKSTCQLGKIPPNLQQKPYHLVQTKV